MYRSFSASRLKTFRPMELPVGLNPAGLSLNQPVSASRAGTQIPRICRGKRAICRLLRSRFASRRSPVRSRLAPYVSVCATPSLTLGAPSNELCYSCLRSVSQRPWSHTLAMAPTDHTIWLSSVTYNLHRTGAAGGAWNQVGDGVVRVGRVRPAHSLQRATVVIETNALVCWPSASLMGSKVVGRPSGGPAKSAYRASKVIRRGV